MRDAKDLKMNNFNTLAQWRVQWIESAEPNLQHAFKGATLPEGSGTTLKRVGEAE